MFFLSCVCYAFVCVCLFVTCGHLLWSPAGKGLTSWLLFVVPNCEFVTFIGILGQVRYLIVSIPDLCTLTYFNQNHLRIFIYIWYLIYIQVYKFTLGNPFSIL